VTMPRLGHSLALIAFVLFATVGAGKRPPGLGDVNAVRVFDHGRYTRVVIELSRPAQFEVREIGRPSRVYLDIDGTWIEEPQRQALVAAGAEIARVRGGQNTLERARVVLELAANAGEHRTFTLNKPFRIVTDVYSGSGVPGSRIVPGVGAGPSRPPMSIETFDMRPVRRVVIDPGDGGKDPGAVGRGKLREKDVVLRVSKRLKRKLERAGLEVHLTRSNDRFISLEDRTRRANELDADLFVSIHANASPSSRTHGVETYLLDTRYDRQTARVAARENGTSIDKLNELQRILASLRLGYNERFAARLAEDVQGRTVGALRTRHKGTRDLGVKHGPFLVLFMADMPAILVEVGFVTNKGEAKRLRSKQFAESAAQGIAAGVLRYRDRHAQNLVAGR